MQINRVERLHALQRSRSRTRRTSTSCTTAAYGFTAWGVRDQHARPARAQHRRHRSGERDERHHHAQLHQHRRRQRRDQGREHRPSTHITDLAQPFLSRPRHVDRQRDGRRRAARFACSTSRSTAPTTGCASSRTPAAAGLVHDVEYRDVCIRKTKNPSRWTRTTRRRRRRRAI